MLTMVTHIRKKDLVQAMSGKEKGKTGKVLRVLNKRGRVVVEKLNLVKRHTKANGQSPGGIIEREASIAAAVLLLYCDKCGKGVRTKRRVSEAGIKHRFCRKCDSQLDK